MVQAYGGPGGNLPGFWDPVTSTSDWCEENYVVSYYMAEFWNTLSNFVYFLAFLFSYKSYRSTDIKMIFTTVGILALTIGSALFHATLKFKTQMMDEVPMIFIAVNSIADTFCFFFWSNYSGRAYPVIVVLVSVCLSYTNIVSTNGIFFRTVFGFLTLTVITVNAYFCLKEKISIRYLLAHYATYSIGFTLWCIDNHYCQTLRELRKTTFTWIPFFFQFHMWWHVFTGISIMFLIKHKYVIEKTVEEKARKKGI